MGTKVKEIYSNPNGDRSQCGTCNPAGKIRYDRLVRFFERHGYWPIKK